MSWQKKTYKIHLEEYKFPSATIHHVLQTATAKPVFFQGPMSLSICPNVRNVSQSPRILDATSMTFSSGPTMAVGRSGCAVAGLDERRVLVAGGFDGCRSAALRWGKVQH